MVCEPDATMQATPQNNQLMSKHRVLGFKRYLRLEWRGQDGQNETEQPDHSDSLGNFITSSTRIKFSVYTAVFFVVAKEFCRIDCPDYNGIFLQAFHRVVSGSD
jgi:hypothetical protein